MIKKIINSTFVTDKSQFSSEEDKLNSLISDRNVFSHSIEKKYNEVPQSTIVIEDPEEAETIFMSLINTAESEILIVFPSTGAFMRQRHFMIRRQNQKKYEKIGIRMMSPLDKNIIGFCLHYLAKMKIINKIKVLL